VANPALAENGAVGCVSCHPGYHRVFSHRMGTRESERRFVERSYGRIDPSFFAKECNSCHLARCTDCHGGSGHAIAPARPRDCFTCHKGYFVGTDYFGMAPREESLRYQRGGQAYGETFLKMTPDVHAEAGLSCGACHSMQSLASGRSASKGCRDCHTLRKRVLEHRIPAHLAKMECYACHAAWAPQEYGTFYLRFGETDSQEEYRLKSAGGEYVKSVYLKKQDAPPLGLNERGMVSPIRPQFIAYFSDLRTKGATGGVNRLLASEWKAYFPHTIRRGTVMCDGCHDAPRRFLMEKGEDRIYQLQKDGMGIPSFWSREGQKVVNGAFLPAARYEGLREKTTAYKKAYLEKWQKLVYRVEDSSER